MAFCGFKQTRIRLGAMVLGLLLVGYSFTYAETDFTSVSTDEDGRTHLTSDTVVDVFAYDTRADSDEGAWRQDLAAQETGWYEESCTVIPCDRGVQSAFPQVAYLILTDSGLDIIDAQTQNLWMRFLAEANNMLVADSPQAVTALNGVVYVATDNRLLMLDFISDQARYYNTTNAYQSDQSIADRNKTVTWTALGGGTIADDGLYDVAVASDGSGNAVAMTTDNGVILLRESVSTILRYYNGQTTDDTRAVALLEDGSLYYTNTTDGTLDVFYNVFADGGDQSTPDAQYSAASTPALPQNPGTSSDVLWADEDGSVIDGSRNRVVFGSSAGVAVIDEGAIGSESTGAAKYLTASYFTELMPGDVRGTWTFEEDAGDFNDRSGNGNALSDNNAVTRDQSAVRGEGIRLTAASSQYLAQAYDSDFDFGTGGFSITGWFRHGDTSGGQVKLLDRTDGISVGFQLSLDTNGNLVGRVSDDGTNWDTATSTSVVDDDSWHQVALVWEPGTSLRISVDGLEEAADGSLLTSGSISGTNATLEFGRDNGGAEYFDGYLDDWMITAESLGAQLIWDMYTKGSGALNSSYPNLITGGDNQVTGLSGTDDGRVVWVSTASGGVSTVKLGRAGNYAEASVLDTVSADSTFITYSSVSTPGLVSDNTTAASAVHTAGREYLVVGTDSGATGMTQGVDWYVASDSFVHGGVLGSTGPCKVSINYQICDTLGQIASGALSSASYRLFDGYQYDDRDAPKGPPLFVSSPTSDTTPHWQWNNVFDRSGVEGYYIRIGFNQEGEEFMAERWLGDVNHWEQDTPFTSPGIYYAQLKVRDMVGNEGEWGDIAVVEIQPSLTFRVEGVGLGTSGLGSGTQSQETVTVSTLSNIIDFGVLTPNEAEIAAQKLIVDMNTGEGYVVTIEQDHPMRVLTGSGDQISSFNASNDAPAYWFGPTLAHLAYHTDDDTLNDVGQGVARFKGIENKYAGLTANPQEVMYSETRANEDENYVVYKLQISPTLSPGIYQNRVSYIASATF